MVGQFGGWTPIGAVKTATGYDVAWKMTGADQYTVWTTDNSRQLHLKRSRCGFGDQSALETIETTF